MENDTHAQMWRTVILLRTEYGNEVLWEYIGTGTRIWLPEGETPKTKPDHPNHSENCPRPC